MEQVTVPNDESPRGIAATSVQQQLRQIVERLPDGVVIVSTDGKIRFVNPAAEDLFGRPEDELVGEDFGYALVPGEAAEIEVVRRGSDVLVAELRLVSLRWEGEPASLVSLRDITDRKRAEERERQLAREQTARIEAEAASQAKSEFLAMMSHELRTPLNAVLGYAELLDLGVAGPLTDAQRQQLGRISASGKHLLGLVNEVLDLARVEAGRLTVHREEHAAPGAIEAALVLALPQAEEKGLTVKSPGDSSRDVSYVGDEDRTRQVLLNLLSNAIKFTPSGGTVALEVEITVTPDSAARLQEAERWVAFRVRDTGIGIGDDQIDAIFAPFVQAQGGHTRSKDGTGLGLTISRRLARLMGGDLTVESTLGSGSTFTLWLPAARPNLSGQTPTSVPRLSGREPRVQGLAEVGAGVLREIDSIVDAFVSRLRHEPSMAAAKGLRYSQLADHAPTLLADIASALIIIEESEGGPSSLLADATDIQRYVAERHGAQRARLGWTLEALAREYDILRDELERMVHRCFLGESGGRIDESLTVMRRQLEQSAATSARSLERALHDGATADR